MQFVLLFFLMIVGGLIEVVSLGLVVPFLAAMAAPEKFYGYPLFDFWADKIKSTYEVLGLKTIFGPWDVSCLLLVFAVLFASAALCAGGCRLLLIWANTRFSNAIGIDFGLKVLNLTLHLPYLNFISKKTSDLISTLTYKLPLVSSAIAAFLAFFVSTVVGVFLITGMILISPQITIIAGSILGLSYGIIAHTCKQGLAECSPIISQEQAKIIKVLQDSCGGIRDILLDGTQSVYCEIYREAEQKLRQAHTKITLIGMSPRFGMESLGIVFFSMLALILSKTNGGLAAALPALGALVLGVQRLLPVLQQGYSAWALIFAYSHPIQEILELLKKPIRPCGHNLYNSHISFKNEIRFEHVSFRYTPQGPKVLSDISFVISKGCRAGLVGKTGSGKSTCLDLLMGLLEPTEGRVLIDGIALNSKNVRAWQRMIAHVPQSVYLSDNSLAENIAFGVPFENIDMKRVREAAQKSQIADFIEASPEGYQALVGERGVRLSGGQRQRIGIARALYKQAKVLVFDEATSALDQETEEAVMNSIKCLGKHMTIFIVSHRASTLQGCLPVIDLTSRKSFNVP